MSEYQILSEFKKNLISFFDELIDLFPCEPDLVMIRIFLKDQLPIEEIMNKFINSLTKDNNRIRKMIKERNELFFLENNIFDESVSTTKIFHFKKLWRSDILDSEDKKQIWRWIDSFCYISEKYIKAKNDNK